MSSEYDIEKYDREREERIKHLESLKEQAEEEFNSYHNEQREAFEYEEEDDNSSVKKKIIGLASATLIGLAGYFGYNSINDNSNSKEDSQNSKVEQNLTNKNGADVREQIASIVSTAMKSDNKEALNVAKMVENRPKDIENSSSNRDHQEPSQANSLDTNREDRDKLINNHTAITSQKSLDIKKDEPKEHKSVAKSHTTHQKRARVEKKKRKKPHFIVVRIKEGDTLASLAERYYGNPMYYKRILRANKGLKRYHLRVGQRIIIPELDKKIRDRLYRIRKGDTLYKISKRFYGTTKKVQKIVDANYKIKSVNSKLNVGDIIYIPK